MRGLYRATLPVPPGINRQYSINRRGDFFTSAKARAWTQTALDRLFVEGWRPIDHPELVRRICITLVCHVAAARDIDSGIKTTIDLIARALGANDRLVDTLEVSKYVEPRRAEQRLEIVVGLFFEGEPESVPTCTS